MRLAGAANVKARMIATCVQDARRSAKVNDQHRICPYWYKATSSVPLLPGLITCIHSCRPRAPTAVSLKL
eukprot:2577120-Pleurochrysis_carterae.AAC.2